MVAILIIYFFLFSSICIYILNTKKVLVMYTNKNNKKYCKRVTIKEALTTNIVKIILV